MRVAVCIFLVACGTPELPDPTSGPKPTATTPASPSTSTGTTPSNTASTGATGDTGTTGGDTGDTPGATNAELRVCAPPLDVIDANCASPRAVDFGKNLVSFERSRRVRLTATGSNAVTLAAPKLLNVTGPCATPFVLTQTKGVKIPPGGEYELEATFMPACAGNFSALLVVETTAPAAASFKVTLTGSAEEDCSAYSETLTANSSAGDPIDVLVVMDDSGSMLDIQNRVKSAVPTLLSTLGSSDYHIGVITTDLDATNRKGKLVNATFTSGAFTEPLKVITKNSLKNAPNAADRGPAKALQHVLEQVDTNGSGTEYGFAAIQVALTHPTVNVSVSDGFGGSMAVAGAADVTAFLRSNAKLWVVLFSDEDDSTGNIATSAAAIKGLTGLRGKGGVPADFKQRVIDDPAANLQVAAVIDPSAGPNQGCPMPQNWQPTDPPYSAGITPNYHTGINALGSAGVVVSLCSDFVSTLAASAIAGGGGQASCAFALNAYPTLSEPHTLCQVGGGCFSDASFTLEPPSQQYPHGRLVLTQAACGVITGTLTLDYTSCSSAADADADGACDAMDNCPFSANADQADENSDGVGNVCAP